jgi:hypothetical protein
MVKGIVGKASAALVMVSAGIMFWASGAFASDISTDPLNGAAAGVSTGLQSFVETNLVPIIVTFLVIGVAAGMLVRWVRKARTVATP